MENPNQEEKLSDKDDFINKEEPVEEKGLKISETWAYKAFVTVAYRLINKPLSVFRLVKQVIAHVQRYESVKEMTSDIKEHIGVLSRLVRSYATGEYRGISFKGVVLTLAALLYFVAPLDFIPDFLIVGLVDDVALLLWVYNNYRGEIEAFRAWEDDKKLKIELPVEEEKV